MRQFKITEESNRYSEAWAVRERIRSPYGDTWPCVAMQRTRYEAELVALRMGEIIIAQSEV